MRSFEFSSRVTESRAGAINDFSRHAHRRLATTTRSAFQQSRQPCLLLCASACKSTGERKGKKSAAAKPAAAGKRKAKKPGAAKKSKKARRPATSKSKKAKRKLR